jgi:hypothetical protein
MSRTSAGEVGEDGCAEGEASLGAVSDDVRVELLSELVAVLEGGEGLVFRGQWF